MVAIAMPTLGHAFERALIWPSLLALLGASCPSRRVGETTCANKLFQAHCFGRWYISLPQCFLMNWMPSERNSFSTTSKCWVNGQNVQPHLRVRIPSSRSRLSDFSLVLSHDAFSHWHP